MCNEQPAFICITNDEFSFYYFALVYVFHGHDFSLSLVSLWDSCVHLNRFGEAIQNALIL
jgi:hypothetical protein